MSRYDVSGVPRELPSVPSPLELADRGGARPSPGQGGQSEPKDELDPELLALPDPPRKERTLTVVVLALAAAAALAMVFALRRDVTYAMAGGAAGGGAVLGDLGAVDPGTLAANENRLVRADGLLGAAGGIRYERPFVEDTFRTVPVAGRTDVWVDVRVPSGQESGRWEPPRSFAGRLIKMSAAGPRHRGLAGAIEETTKAKVPPGAWLLVDGEEPDGSRWAVVLAAMFLGFAVWNAAAIGRIVRRVA
jgi:hypothetical protein